MVGRTGNSDIAWCFGYNNRIDTGKKDGADPEREISCIGESKRGRWLTKFLKMCDDTIKEKVKLSQPSEYGGQDGMWSVQKLLNKRKEERLGNLEIIRGSWPGLGERRPPTERKLSFEDGGEPTTRKG
jgi:hypothetical protein